MKRTESIASETAILVGVLLADRSDYEHPLDELEGLAETAGARVVGRLTQRRDVPEVAGRRDRMTVSLVGYTNAGKSTLLNILTGSQVLTENKLFATLDTRTRRWQLPGWGPVLLSDTVGFIRDLPHHLIASFKATLEESRQADLLLHVADASNPAAFEQIKAVNQVLGELGCGDKASLLVLNQVDRLPDRSFLDVLQRHH